MHPARKAEIDRLARLALLGAEQAAHAFSELVDRPIRSAAPIVIDAESDAAPTRVVAEPDERPTGVFFELDGCLEAVVGILLPRAASTAIVRRMIGVDEGDPPPDVIEPALMELGNILASHVASAIADRLQSRLLPSIPTLAMDQAEEALRAFIEDIAGPDALRIVLPFADDRGEIRGRLILVPTQVAHWAPIHPASGTPDV